MLPEEQGPIAALLPTAPTPAKALKAVLETPEWHKDKATAALLERPLVVWTSLFGVTLCLYLNPPWRRVY